jgi:hypothetical protein
MYELYLPTISSRGLQKGDKERSSQLIPFTPKIHSTLSFKNSEVDPLDAVSRELSEHPDIAVFFRTLVRYGEVVEEVGN